MDSGAGAVDTGDWRTELLPDSRQRIVNKILEILKRHLPFYGPEGSLQLKKIAVRFEEKIYAAATNRSDYLRKISLKMLNFETKRQNPMTNSLHPNAASRGQNALGTGDSSASINRSSGCESSLGTAASFTDLKQNHQSRRLPCGGGSLAHDYQYLEDLTAAELSYSCEPSSQKGTVAFLGGGDSVSGCGILSESESDSVFDYSFNDFNRSIHTTKGLDLDLNLPPPPNI